MQALTMLGQVEQLAAGAAQAAARTGPRPQLSGPPAPAAGHALSPARSQLPRPSLSQARSSSARDHPASRALHVPDTGTTLSGDGLSGSDALSAPRSDDACLNASASRSLLRSLSRSCNVRSAPRPGAQTASDTGGDRMAGLAGDGVLGGGHRAVSAFATVAHSVLDTVVEGSSSAGRDAAVPNAQPDGGSSAPIVDRNERLREVDAARQLAGLLGRAANRPIPTSFSDNYNIA
ncbi:hypothetical protein V8C86DRAFT_2748273 [Haematococcus lacustris]